MCDPACNEQYGDALIPLGAYLGLDWLITKWTVLTPLVYLSRLLFPLQHLGPPGRGSYGLSWTESADQGSRNVTRGKRSETDVGRFADGQLGMAL